MIPTGKEYYSSPYYFFVKETKNGFDLYFSSEETLTEARKKDRKISISKEKESLLKKYLNKLVKSKKKKSTGEIEKELDELVNIDGALSNSKIPILDPHLTPRKTMDQTIPSTRQTNDPFRTGYRTTYWGEGKESKTVVETDLSGAFGFEETSGMTGPKAYKYYIDELGLEPPDAEERVRQQGKNPFKKKKKMTISEIQKQKMIKVLEDILVNKSSDTDINKKESKVSKILQKNLKSILKQAEKEGLSKAELIKLLKNE